MPVGELLDVVGRTLAGGDAGAVLVRHPLQPFDPRNFAAGELIPARAWSFDRVGLDGARALEAERVEPGPFLPGPLPPLDTQIVELEDLLAFVAHPVRAFLRRRLDVSVRAREDEIEDALPVELDALEQYQVGQRLLDARARRDRAARGDPRRDRARDAPAGRARAAGRRRDRPDRRRGLRPGGRGGPGSPSTSAWRCRAAALLSGTVPGVVGDTLRAVSYARIGPRHRLRPGCGCSR